MTDAATGGNPTDAGHEALRRVLADGPEAWIVGGAVREHLRGVPSVDLDIAIAGEQTAKSTARALARETGGHAFPLSDAFGAWRVSARARPDRPAWQVDVTPLQGPDLATDLSRRDLTVNAMAEPVTGGPLIDPYGGRDDLAAGVLRMVGPEAFSSDPVRVLRLARFAAELDANAEPATSAAARAAAPRLSIVPGERMLPELERMLVAPGWSVGLQAAEDSGALAALFPATTGDDGRLAAATAARLRAVLGPDATVPEAADADRAALAVRIAADDRRAFLGLAALLVTGDEAGEALRRLRPSRRLQAGIERTVTLTRVLADAAGAGTAVTERALYRALRPLGADGPEAVLVARGVLDGAAAPWAALLSRALRWADHPPQAPVRGDVLAAELGLSPGPALGALLEELTIAADAGRIATPEEAVVLARRSLGAGRAP